MQLILIFKNFKMDIVLSKIHQLTAAWELPKQKNFALRICNLSLHSLSRFPHYIFPFAALTYFGTRDMWLYSRKTTKVKVKIVIFNIFDTNKIYRELCDVIIINGEFTARNFPTKFFCRRQAQSWERMSYIKRYEWKADNRSYGLKESG